MRFNAKILLISGCISYFGGALTRLVHASLFANAAEHTAEFSFFFIALGLPPILLKSLFKYILDYFSARSILIFAQLCRSFLLFIQLFFMWNVLLEKMGLCLLILCHSIFHYIFISALFTYLPMLIHEDERDNYLAQSGGWTQVGYLLGVIMFTLTNTTIGFKTLLIIDLAIYLFSAFVFAILKVCSLEKKSSLAEQGDAKQVSACYTALSRHVAALPLLRQAFFIALPIILLSFFTAISTTTALSVSKLKLGATGLGIIETLFRFGVILVGFTYQYFFKKWINTYHAWLTLLGIACCFILVMQTMPTLSIALYMVSAFFVGVAYSALTTISRSVFYTAQHTATYNQSILMVNLMESIGQIFIMLATANLIHNTVLTVLLTALFFILSFWMTRHNILYLSIK